YYGSRFGGSRLNMFPPVIKWLLGINILIFILDSFLLPKIGGSGMSILQVFGALWPVGSELYWPWQYFTYMFFHGTFTHIFFNMLMLWMFGIELEQLWGSKRFLLFYLI